MKPRPRYSLQRTMIVYFLLIGFAALLVGIEFVAETQGDTLRNAWLAQARAAAHPLDTAGALAPLDHLRHKAVLMIAIILGVMLIVLTMFIKNITEPLQHMIIKAREISQGDLRQTIRIEAHNELAELGGVINEMASNLQEIIHLSRNTCQSGVDRLAAARRALAPERPSAQDLAQARADLAQLTQTLATLADMVAEFEFYAIDGRRHG
jgi:methyl-accepting chemotaxis protein